MRTMPQKVTSEMGLIVDQIFKYRKDIIKFDYYPINFLKELKFELDQNDEGLGDIVHSTLNDESFCNYTECKNGSDYSGVPDFNIFTENYVYSKFEDRNQYTFIVSAPKNPPGRGNNVR